MPANATSAVVSAPVASLDAETPNIAKDSLPDYKIELDEDKDQAIFYRRSATPASEIAG